MAVAIQSVSTQGFAAIPDSSNMTISKPSGVVSGDLMVAHVVVVTRDGGHSFSPGPSGWTNVLTQKSGNNNQQVYYKVAGGSEPASYDFPHSDDSGTEDGFCAGAIYRIDGHGDVASIQDNSANDAGSGTFSFANGVTPTLANSLILLLFVADEDTTEAAGASSSYAIATDNPSWTERYDLAGDLDPNFGAGDPSNCVIAGASAVRPETTATGNASVTISNMEDAIGSMIVIPPVSNVTASPSVIDLTLSVQAPSVTGDANVTPGVIDLTLGVQAPTVSTQQNTAWTNESLPPDTTWTLENF